eukprot:PhM_4_TR3041/c1_g2_i4/m.45306
MMIDMATLGPNPVHAREFEMTVSPALCADPVVDLLHGITATTISTSTLVLGGVVTTMANYWSVVKSISVANCRVEVPKEDVYEILWQFKPSYWEFLGANSEPHYYSSHTAAQSADGALAACASYEMWGLPGYSVTLTSAGESSSVFAFHTSSTFWAGAHGWTPTMWLWRDGPEADVSMFATAWSGQWNALEPNNPGYAALEAAWAGGTVHGGFAEVGLGYVCEYGGTEGTYGFRGAIHLIVSAVSCVIPASRRYYDFPGVCHVAFDAQQPGATKTRKLFTSDVVPDLMSTDTHG